MRALVTQMERALPRTPSGERVAPFPPMPGRAGRFYPGRECYIFWSDCNAWTVKCLRAAGLAGSSVLVVAEEQVPGRLRGFRRVRAKPVQKPPAGAGQRKEGAGPRTCNGIGTV